MSHKLLFYTSRNGSTSDVFGKVTPVDACGRRWDRLRSTARRASVCLNTADVACVHAAPIVANLHASRIVVSSFHKRLTIGDCEYHTDQSREPVALALMNIHYW